MMIKDLFPVPIQTTAWDRKAFSTSLANIVRVHPSFCLFSPLFDAN